MDGTYFVVAGLCLGGLTVRTSYELLKKAGRVDTKNKAIFPVVLVAMCVMLASWPLMCALDAWRLAVPGGVRWVGLGVVAAGAALAIAGLLQLRGLENIDHLVTTGVYSRLRHPMYAGFVLWIGGWVVAYGAVASGSVALACIGNILYWGHLEEVALEPLFGEDYRAYRRRTWF